MRVRKPHRSTDQSTHRLSRGFQFGAECGIANPEAWEIYGVRELLWRVPAVRRLAHSRGLLEIVVAILGLEAFAVRGLFFDKTMITNWNLAWHQESNDIRPNPAVQSLLRVLVN